MTNFQVLSLDVKKDSKREGVWRYSSSARQFGVDECGFASEEITQCLFSSTTKNEAEMCLTVSLSVSKTGDFDYGLEKYSEAETYSRAQTIGSCICS